MFSFLAKWLTQYLSKNVHQSQGEPLSNFDRLRYEIKASDVLLVEGRSRISRVIRQTTNSTWTHAMLYIGRLYNIENKALRELVVKAWNKQSKEKLSDNEQLIIESELGLGTIVHPLSRYRSEHLRICRPRGITYQDSQKVINYAIKKLGHEYNVRQIFDLLRFLYPYAVLPRKWRSSLFVHTPGQETKTVCSTMLAEAFSAINFPILPLIKKSDSHGVQLFQRNPKLCTPKDFDYSPYFEIIKYPFFDFEQYEHYSLLPWRGNSKLTGEESQLYINLNKAEKQK